MSEFAIAFGVWLPLGTVVPLVLARLTGADWRGAFIEASLFATMGLLVFPILFGIVAGVVLSDPSVNLMFAASYVLALGCVLLFRRRSNQTQQRYGRRS
jgi:hypothetical protein